NIAMSYTTAARASLALSTLPLQTMVVGALLGIEPLTKRKTLGVCVAILGVFAALASGLRAAPSGAWRGELIMTGAVLCMAFYNFWSHSEVKRARLSYGRYGCWSGRALYSWVADRPYRCVEHLWSSAMARGCLPRNWWRRACFHPLGASARKGDTNARSQY